ncbi:MAG TPA: hypothetical protein VFM50_09260 [Nocardioidaceae bacterium]|nr:hypothetical protein [Nocardioidaceae bacterium]
MTVPMSSPTSTVSPGSTAPTSRSRGPSGVPTRRWPTALRVLLRVLLGVLAVSASLALLSPFPERVQTGVSAWCVLLAAVFYLVWGTARGDLAARRWLTAQTAGVLGFAAVAVVAAATDPAVARYVLAAGWLAHAGWDLVHHHADRVVPRWYAELCLICDVLIAGALLTIGTL